MMPARKVDSLQVVGLRNGSHPTTACLHMGQGCAGTACRPSIPLVLGRYPCSCCVAVAGIAVYCTGI